MKLRISWIFLFLAAVLLGWSLWDLQKDQAEVQKKIDDSNMVAFPADQIQNLKIVTPGKDLELNKTVDGWKLISPLEDWADSSAVEDFIFLMTQQKVVKNVTEGETPDLAIYGLSPAAGQIQVTHQNQQQVTWEVGQKRSYEGQAYLRRDNDNDVFLAGADWAQWLLKKPLEFRDRRVLRGKLGAISEIYWKNSLGQWTLRQKENLWQWEGHPEVKLDVNRVYEVLTQISEAKASDILKEKTITAVDRQAFGLNKPAVEIRLKLTDKDWAVRMARNNNQAYGEVSDPIFLLRLEPSFFEKMSQLKIFDVRDKKEPFDFNKDLVKKIEIHTPLKKQVIAYKNSQWIFGEAQVLPNEKVQSLLEGLKGFKLADYSPSIPAKTDYRISLKEADEKIVFELAWQAAKKNRALAKSNLSQEGLLLDQIEIEKLKLNELFSPTEAP